jgi:hypothetical protein
MKVSDAIKLLKQCDPDALLVAHLAFQGVEEIVTLERKTLGGVGYRMSFEEVPVVILSNGSPDHMRSQGMDVLDASEVAEPGPQAQIAKATGLKEPLRISARTSTNLVAWEVTDSIGSRRFFDRSSVHVTDPEVGWAEVLRQVRPLNPQTIADRKLGEAIADTYRAAREGRDWRKS